MRTAPLAFDSPVRPDQRRSGTRSAFLVVIDGGRDAEDPPIVVAETPAPKPTEAAKTDPPAATVVDQAPRWWRTFVVLSLRYGRQSVVGWPLYTALLAWRSYDAKCAMDALKLRFGRGNKDFDIGLKLSEIAKDGRNTEDRRVLENATNGGRWRPFGLEATFADETVNGASLFHHMNWVCGLVRSPILPTINP